MKSDQAVMALGALAQDTRLAMFRVLVKRGPKGYTPGDLGTKLKIPAPTLSFHLKELQSAELVISRREGRFIHYSVNFDTMQGLIGFLTEKCCSLADNDDREVCAEQGTSIARKRA
jgi:ArsR family transcriptional regulator, arsenate/arsenite/antimonite-responsive transcriptional repressor